MLRLTLEMNTRTTYHGQRLTLSGSGIRLQVGGIFNQEGKRIQSAYVDGATRVAFRSSSARAYVFIEISEEMSHFEDDGSVSYLYFTLLYSLRSALCLCLVYLPSFALDYVLTCTNELVRSYVRNVPCF